MGEIIIIDKDIYSRRRKMNKVLRQVKKEHPSCPLIPNLCTIERHKEENLIKVVVKDGINYP